MGIEEKSEWGELTSEAVQSMALNSASRSAILRHPIIRQLYIFYLCTMTLFVYVPLWIIQYIPRDSRPRESWSINRCIQVRAIRLFCKTMAQCEVDYLCRDLTKDLDPLTLKYSHPVTIPPAPSSHLVGYPAETLAQLNASRDKWNPHYIYRRRRHAGAWGGWKGRKEAYGFEAVKAFWYTGKKRSKREGPRVRLPGQPVGLHFHGGGYLCGTAAESDLTASISKSLVDHSPIHHVLSIDYRLAPLAPWPLPLLEAISSYRYLVDQGIPERDIVVFGDSAGGHLAVALLRWIRDDGAAVGLLGPRGLVVMSPWADVGFTYAWGDENKRYNAESDWVDDSYGPFATSLLLRALPAKAMHTDVYLSPSSLLIAPSATGSDSFEGFPPTYVVYGGAERLARSIRYFWDRLQLARKVEPNSLPDRLIEGPDSVHDFLIFDWQSKEASVIYADLDAWLRDLLAETVPETKRGVSVKERSSKVKPTEPGIMKTIEDIGSEGMKMTEGPDLSPSHRLIPLSPDGHDN